MSRGIKSEGITLSYKSATGDEFVELTNLQEIPELGGDTDKIEVTCLSDPAHVYIDGIKNYGDSLTFKFVFEKTQFMTLNSLTDSQQWKVTLPEDAGSCTFGGSCSVKMDGVGVNAALTYTLSITPNTEMVWA